jgi:hypothetical protein
MIKRNYLSLLGLLAGILFISSCKRDDVFGDIDPNTDRIIVEFVDAQNVQSVAMDYSTDVIDVDLAEIRFMVRSYVTNEVTVRVTSSADVVNDYNNDNGTNYTPVPAGVFVFEPNEIVLTPEERKKKVHIRIRSSDIAVGEYAIGLSIAEVSAGEVSQIAGTILVIVSVKNQYDGRYLLEGAFYHPGSSPGYDPFTIEVEMRTSSPNSVKMYVPEFGGYYHPGLFGGVLDAFSGQEPEYTVDPATNAVTVQNSFVGAVTFYTMASGFNSRYDPFAKIIYAKFGYNYSPGVVFNPATTREWTDKLTYLGPR